MALKKDIDFKLYYSVKEVAALLGVNESLLRYWEREFPQITPRKSGRNIRQYTKEDVETVRQIYYLVKVRGLKLAAAREVLRKEKPAVERDAEILRRLQSVKEQLNALRRELNALE